jgi:hypothetical protein
MTDSARGTITEVALSFEVCWRHVVCACDH